MPRRPPTITPLRQRLLERAAREFFAREFDYMEQAYGLTPGGLSRQHYPALHVAFMQGAEFELDRLSNATGVDFHSLPPKTLLAGSRRWLAAAKRLGINLCAPGAWRRLLTESFTHGADWVAESLWPDPPPPRRAR